MAYTSASKTSLLVPRSKRRSVHPPGVFQTHVTPTPALSGLEPSVQTVSLCLQSCAVRRASALSSTTICPGKTCLAPHSWASTVPPGRGEAAALRHIARLRSHCYAPEIGKYDGALDCTYDRTARILA